MTLGPLRKAAEKQRVVGGARRRKLALPDLGEVTRKSISLPGGFQLDLRLTRKDQEHSGSCTDKVCRKSDCLQNRLRPGCRVLRAHGRPGVEGGTFPGETLVWPRNRAEAGTLHW